MTIHGKHDDWFCECGIPIDEQGRHVDEHGRPDPNYPIVTPSTQYALTEAVDEVLRPYLRTLGLSIGTMDKIVTGVAARLHDYHGARVSP